jgi:predicted double-glycine peptidase
MSNTKGYNNRLNAAKIFYNMYSGQTYSGGTFDGIQSSNSTCNTTTSSGPLAFGDILSTLTGSFTNAFSNLFSGNKQQSNTTSNTTSTTGSSYNSNTGGAIYSGTDAIGDRVNKFPYFNQLEKPWAPVQYSSRNDPSQTIKSSGCGPTSMSMVLRSFGQNATPASVAQVSASRGHRTANQGTSWSMFKDIANLAQVNATQFSSAEDAKNYLRKGYPVIASFGPGDFTKGGHYVVLSGIQGDNFYVNDPASRDRSSKLWPSYKLNQSKQFWAFSKNGKGTLYAGDSANADHYAGSGSGLLYGASRAGNRILLDNSGRFSGGASFGTNDLNIVSGGTLFTGDKQNQYKTSGKSNNYSSMSKETAILLKTIITLVTSLVDNTSKISDIYDIVKEVCSRSGNSQLGAIANKMSNAPKSTMNQKTLESLNDLRDMVDSILA